MKRLVGTLGALAVLGVSALPSSAQTPRRGTNLDAPGSDRAGKARRVDGPVPEPTPAPGSRLAADAADNRAREVSPGAPSAGVVPPPVIGSHQIDRYDALKKVQQAVKDSPKSLADWVILGEIAHEVAMDAPAEQADQYFKTSREAFEKALALDPNNAGLKAAVQFAKDQQANASQFESSRDAYTDTYLNARRRDLSATGHTPYVKMYEPPLPARTLPGPNPDRNLSQGGGRPEARQANIDAANLNTPIVNAATANASTAAGGRTPAHATPAAASAAVRATTDGAVDSAVPLVRPGNTPVAEASPAVTPAPNNAPATDAANYGTQQNYSGPSLNAPTRYVGPRYVPFVAPGNVPYTYQQYSGGYFPAGVYDNPAAPPVTAQRLGAGLVGGVNNGAADSAPLGPGTGPGVGAGAGPGAGARPVPNALERQILNRAGGNPAPR